MSETRIALVTGASRGIGRAIARALAADGFKVVVNYHSQQEQATTLVAEIEAAGGCAWALGGDVTVAADMDEIAAAIETQWGPVDVLVNNAGVLRDNFLALMSEAQWDAVIDANLKGAFLSARAVVKGMMKRRRGHLVNMTSISGLIGTPGQVNYAASKGGLIAMTRALAKELAPYGIQVNSIAPGFIETEMLTRMNPKQLAELVKLIPLKRLGQPEEVAAVVRFLVSAANSYMTGAVLVVDGGLSV